MSVVETFEYIIRHQSAEELVPFLLQLSKVEVVSVRKKTLSLYKELGRVVELERGWGSLMTAEQGVMLFFAGVTTYSAKEALSSSFIGMTYQSEKNPHFWTVMEHARPNWLGKWFSQWMESSMWHKPDYHVLRDMEARQLIAYEPRLFTRAVPSILPMMGYELSQRTPVPPNAAAVMLARLQADRVLLKRDLPLLFDFDTQIAFFQAEVQLQPDFDKLTLEEWKDWHTWSRQHPKQYVTWLALLPQLVASGHLSRAELLTRCLLALRRDFRRSLLTWFKNLFLALQPTNADRLERQRALVELVTHASPLVVSFALDQLKMIWLEPAFQLGPFLHYAENFVTRKDLKTRVRTLLADFEKLLKHDPALAPELGRLSAAALANPDSGVQERAAGVLIQILNNSKLLLREEEKQELLATLTGYAELVHAAVRTLLAPWLPSAGPVREEIETTSEAYTSRHEFSPDLSPATAIEPVRDWHELLFLTGQVLRFDNPAALERWLDGLVRLQGQWPTDYAIQLQPYIVQALPVPYQKKNVFKELLESGFASYTPQPWYRGCIEALLLSWAYPTATSRVDQVVVDNFRSSDPLVRVEQQRMLFVEHQFSVGKTLPLLSTPTHAPYWVAPSVLVQKLLAYEAAEQVPSVADLVVALARTAHAHVENAEAARTLLPLVQQQELQTLLHWFLDPNAKALPKIEKEVLNASVRAGTDTLAENLPWLWAVAARTKYPNDYFPELARIAGEYVGITRPWQPEWHFVEHWDWTWLALPHQEIRYQPPAALLYSQHQGFAGIEEIRYTLPFDLAYLLALLPNNPAPLYWHVVRSAGRVDGLGTSEQAVISQALRTMLGVGPAFDEAATLLLAVGLTHHVPVCRALALEVLLQAVTERRLVPTLLGHTLGRLLAATFVPVPRLTEQLAQARAINAATDDALHQTLDALLPALGAQPPRNTRKLLEAYADLAARTRREIPAPVEARLQEWASQAALRKQATGLLAKFQTSSIS